MQIAQWDPASWEWDPRPYQVWLADHADELPDGAREYITHPAHYDYGAFRTTDGELPPGTGLCTKDLLLRRVDLDAAGSLPLRLGFLFPGFELADVGAYDLVLDYLDVTRFEISRHADGRDHQPSRLSHVIIDEIVPRDAGIVHEIGFASGQLIVECRDLTATWR